MTLRNWLFFVVIFHYQNINDNFHHFLRALDQNSNMLFLRNEFSKIFEDLFMMTQFTEIAQIFDLTKNF